MCNSEVVLRPEGSKCEAEGREWESVLGRGKTAPSPPVRESGEHCIASPSRGVLSRGGAPTANAILDALAAPKRVLWHFALSILDSGEGGSGGYPP